MDSLRLAVLSDIHLTEDPPRDPQTLPDSVRIFEETRARAEAGRPDFIVYTGDLFEARHFGLPNLALAKSVLERTGVPWFVLRGNHDARYKTTQDGYGRADFARAFRGRGPSEGRAYWRHEVPGTPFVLIGIDTAQDLTSHGRVDPEQLGWLDALLSGYRDRRVIAFMHHPAVIFDDVLTTDPDLSIFFLENHDEVRELLVRHRCVKLVVSGHNHTRRHKEVSGLHFVGCPSISTWPAMYTSFALSGERVSFDYHEIPDRASARSAYDGMLDPRASWLKGFKSAAAVEAYFSAAPVGRALPIRSSREDAEHASL